MKKNYAKVFILWCYVMTIMPSLGQEQWYKLTDFHEVNAIASLSTGFNNHTYGVTADRWVYKSTDDGFSWTPFLNVPAFYNAGDVKASQVSSRVFCISMSNGLIFTDNEGLSWQWHLFTEGGGNSGFGALILGYELKDQMVIVSTLGDLTNGISNPIYVSNNNGTSFQPVGSINFFPIQFHIENSNTVWSNSATGLMKTTALQSSVWTTVAFDNQMVWSMSKTGAVIYTSIRHENETDQLFKSSDNGETWTEIILDTDYTDIHKIHFEASTQQLYVATDNGVYLDTNGNTQTIVNSGQVHNIHPTNSHVLLSGWRVPGVLKVNPDNLIIHPETEGLFQDTELMCVTDDGQVYTASKMTSFVSRYDIATNAWESYSLFDHLPETRVVSMARDANGQCLIGGMHYIAQTNPAGAPEVLVAESDAPPAFIYNILFPQKLFAGPNGQIAMVQHNNQNYIDYSPDWGQNWSTLFSNTDNNAPMLLSIQKVLLGTSVKAVLATPMNPQPSLIVQFNNGDWQILPQPDTVIRDAFLSPDDEIYVTTVSKLLKWDNTTNQWITLNVNLGQDPNKSTELEWNNDMTMYLILRSHLNDLTEEGIYYKESDSEVWAHEPFPTAQDGSIIRLQNLTFVQGTIPVACSKDFNGINDTNGIYYFHSEKVLSTDYIPTVKSEAYVYPNPVKDKLHIHIPNYNAGMGIITDMLGRSFQIPTASNVIDVSSLPNGTYILQLFDNNQAYRFRFIKTNE